MKVWLAKILWDALWMVSERLHDWFFDPAKWKAKRERLRLVWWAYEQSAESTTSKKDDRRAECFQKLMNFQHSPEDKAQGK